MKRRPASAGRRSINTCSFYHSAQNGVKEKLPSGRATRLGGGGALIAPAGSVHRRDRVGHETGWGPIQVVRLGNRLGSEEHAAAVRECPPIDPVPE